MNVDEQRPSRILIIGSGGAGKSTLARCATVVFLDLPRLLCLWRVVARAIRYAGRTRPDMPPGCRERLSWEFVQWVWQYPTRRRGPILEKLAALRGKKNVVILTSSAAVREFLDAHSTHG